MYQNFIIPYLYEAQHVSGETPPIIRSLKLHWQPLVFNTWKVVGRQAQWHCAWQRPPTTRPTTFHVWKTRGCKCSLRLLMMDGVSPETCWASYKHGIINLGYIVASCWIFPYEFSFHNFTIWLQSRQRPELRQKRPHLHWGPHSLLFNGVLGFCPDGEAASTWSWPIISI